VQAVLHAYIADLDSEFKKANADAAEDVLDTEDVQAAEDADAAYRAWWAEFDRYHEQFAKGWGDTSPSDDADSSEGLYYPYSWNPVLC
jgi:hypothetical protein